MIQALRFFYQPSNQFNSQALSVDVRVNLSISISNSFNHGFGKLLLVFIHKFSPNEETNRNGHIKNKSSSISQKLHADNKWNMFTRFL